MSSSATLATPRVHAPSVEAIQQRAHKAERPALGILLILLSTMAFACGDAFTKSLAESGLPPMEVAWLRYLGFTLLMLPLAAGKAPSRTFHANRPLLQVLCGLCAVGTVVLFSTSLAFLPLAEATAVYYVSPLFIAALSIIVLGESVGMARWATGLAGLAGVLLVIRPGAETFEAASLLPAAAAVLWAGQVVISRKLGGQDSLATTLLFTGLVGLGILTAVMPFVWVDLSSAQLVDGFLIALCTTGGNLLVIFAFRQANASLLAPISYAQIVTGAVVGYIVFGSVPDTWTVVGSVVIIASGIAPALLERRRIA